MKLEFIKDNKSKILEDYILSPILIGEKVRINPLDDTELVLIDCSLDESIELIKKFAVLMDERYDMFYHKCAREIDEFDKIMKTRSKRYALVYSNIDKISEELKNLIWALCNKSRASGIAHIYVTDNDKIIWEPVRSYLIKVF